MSWNTKNGIKIAGTEVSDALLIRLGWLLPMMTVVTSMSIHALSGHARAIPFFVSESDYPGLEGTVFTTGLAITGVLVCILAYRLNLAVQERDSKWIQISLYSGILAGMSLSVLAFANIYDMLLIHSIASLLVFVGGFVWGGINAQTLLKQYALRIKTTLNGIMDDGPRNRLDERLTWRVCFLEER